MMKFVSLTRLDADALTCFYIIARTLCIEARSNEDLRSAK
jgi:hypothetical protein